MYSLIAWYAFILFISFLKCVFVNPHLYQQVFHDAASISYTMGILVAWAPVSYCIGFYGRKSFLTKRESYRRAYPMLNSIVVDRYYFLSYVAKVTGIAYKLAIVAIPLYALIRKEFYGADFVVIIFLIFMSIALFYIHKKMARQSMIR